MSTRYPVILALCAAISTCACTRMYALPDAPPQNEWDTAPKQPAVSPEEAARIFLDAKRAAIQCFAALADKNWTAALSWMSRKTVGFFDAQSQGAGAAAALESGTLSGNGNVIPFDPVNDVFIHDLVDIRDSFSNSDDNDENESKKILYAISRSGEARKLTFILEDGKWRLDAPFVKSQLLTE